MSIMNYEILTDHYPSGQKMSEVYIKNNRQHREDGPAETIWHENGKVKQEVWYFEDVLHRGDGGPTVSFFFETGATKALVYRVHGKRHRLDGPALIRYLQDGTAWTREYYINGKDVSLDLYRAGIIASNGDVIDQASLELTMAMMNDE